MAEEYFISSFIYSIFNKQKCYPVNLFKGRAVIHEHSSKRSETYGVRCLWKGMHKKIAVCRTSLSQIDICKHPHASHR